MIIIDAINSFDSKGFFYLVIRGVERDIKEDRDFTKWYAFEIEFKGDCTNNRQDWYINDALEPIIIGKPPIGVPLAVEDCEIFEREDLIHEELRKHADAKLILRKPDVDFCEYLIKIKDCFILLATNDNDGSSSPKWQKNIENKLITKNYIGKM